jgi:RNA polymerase sigma factor (sigma-70 family)
MKPKKPDFEMCLAEVEKTTYYFAHSISKKCKIEFDDAKQELMIAAWRAYQTYDCSKAKFSTYAVWRMKNVAKSLINRTMQNLVHLNTSRESDLNLFDKNGEQISLDEIVIDERIDVENQIVTAFVGEREKNDATVKLNEIEDLLFQLFSVYPLMKYKHAYDLFRMLRYTERRREDGRILPLTISEASREMGIVVQRMSTIFRDVITPLGTAQGRAGIREQIIIANMRKENTMAKAKKSKVVKKEVATESAGRPARKGGMREKIDWAEKMFVVKGKSRSDAVAGLVEKYPDMSLNYARTLVYSYMKESDWPATEKKAPSKKPAAKKAAPKKEEKVSKKAPAPTSKKKAVEKKPVAKKAKKEEASGEVESDIDEFSDF